DTEEFRFTQLTDWRHVHFLPGSTRYGDLPSLLALAAPSPLWIAGEKGEIPELVDANYTVLGANRVLTSAATDQPGIEGAQFLLGLVGEAEK
ncbi:hypothetical protein NL516_26420, partial [Klebsiella pneumoniae]|nr:hypothetical protein [Klebsiella pneumoniae]